MSFFKNVVGGGFWRGIVVTLLTALLISGCGAGLVVAGLWPVERAWIVVCVAWLLGAFAGGRCSGVGEGGTLWRCMLVATVGVVILWLLGLTTPGGAELMRRLWYAAAAVVGAVAAAAMPRKKRRSRKSETRGRR